MEIHYEISNKGREEIFTATGKVVGWHQRVTINPARIGEMYRKFIAEHYDVSECITIQAFKLLTASADESVPPLVDQGKTAESDILIENENQFQAFMDGVMQERKTLESQLVAETAKWEKEHAEYVANKEAERKHNELMAEAESAMQPDLDRKDKRIGNLERYLTALIKASNPQALERAGLVQPQKTEEEEEDEEVGPEQQEALETCGLDC